jgi:hypothetical protein
MTTKIDYRLHSIFCQIDSIGTAVSAPHSDFTMGELRMVSDALREASKVIENEIAWRAGNPSLWGDAA